MVLVRKVLKHCLAYVAAREWCAGPLGPRPNHLYLCPQTRRRGPRLLNEAGLCAPRRDVALLESVTDFLRDGVLLVRSSQTHASAPRCPPPAHVPRGGACAPARRLPSLAAFCSPGFARADRAGRSRGPRPRQAEDGLYGLGVSLHLADIFVSELRASGARGPVTVQLLRPFVALLAGGGARLPRTCASGRPPQARCSRPH